MAEVGKIHDIPSGDPEKVHELAPVTTSGEGEVDDFALKYADTNDGDEALKAFAGHDGEPIVMTPEMEKKLLRKIDLRLMPVYSQLCIISALSPVLNRHRYSVWFMVLTTWTRQPSRTRVSWVCKRTYT
jgi:ACS family allantoate permease-like MFS transporter